MTALPLHQRVIGHVMERVRDRARMLTFARFVGRRFLDDRLFEAAGALAYTTAFAVVPLSFVVFGVLSAFPGFDRWTDALGDYIFNNFVPRAAEAVKTYLLPNRETKLQMTTAGVIALIVSLLVTLTSVEAIFNRIWRVPTARPKFSRVLVYWTVMTLGALLALSPFLAVAAAAAAIALAAALAVTARAALALSLAARSMICSCRSILRTSSMRRSLSSNVSESIRFPLV